MNIWPVFSAVVFAFFMTPVSALAEDYPAAAEVRTPDFTVLAILTKTLNWREVWETPRETSPSFEGIENLSVGDGAVFLAFFSHRGQAGKKVKLACAMTAYFEDKVVQSVPLTPCYDRQLPENPNDLFMLGINVEIKVSEEDIGKWTRFELEVLDQTTGNMGKAVVGYLGRGKDVSQ
jgi:hypothetical protein